jgi:hypothetical protein
MQGFPDFPLDLILLFDRATSGLAARGRRYVRATSSGASAAVTHTTAAPIQSGCALV